MTSKTIHKIKKVRHFTKEYDYESATCRLHTSLINDPFSRNEWVCIMNPDSNKKIYRLPKGITTRGFSADCMELDYESLLQLETKGSTAEGEFIPCNLQIEQATFYERNIFANLKHPDYTYKISFKYALLSVGLGILSLAISLSSWLNKI